MDSIFFENIRCFATRQEVPLAPLTVLVGENSSGKSTVLALVRLAWDLTLGDTPDFNEEPFLLGAYQQIVNKRAMRRTFLLGAQVSGSHQYRIEGTFGSRGGLPKLLKLRSYLADGSEIQVTEGAKKEAERIARHVSGFRKINPEELTEQLRAAVVAFALHSASSSRPYAFAPVRTRPQRTYDPITGTERPEGSHVPMILASGPLAEPDRWKKLFSALNAFGAQSGLFSKVKVRHLGQGEGDPFQIQVHIGGNVVNLIDVGYGVSQVLPIVVDCLRGQDGGTFLLQQPEVHLHPRAQAELASFLGVLARQQKKRFVIETHSDYLVDRIRMDIRDGKGLTPEDVSLLYFERKNGQANIHRLHLDEHGNLLDPPPGYRDFFLEEARRFLGG